MPSFDIVSEIEQHELQNVLTQTQRELDQRFDFQGTKTEIELLNNKFFIISSSEDRAEAGYDVLLDKCIKRKISLKFLLKQKILQIGNKNWKLEIEIKIGINKENAKKIIETIKQEKNLKITTAILGESVRVTGKSKDDLQSTMSCLRIKNFPLEISFINFRN